MLCRHREPTYPEKPQRFLRIFEARILRRKIIHRENIGTTYTQLLIQSAEVVEENINKRNI